MCTPHNLFNTSLTLQFHTAAALAGMRVYQVKGRRIEMEARKRYPGADFVLGTLPRKGSSAASDGERVGNKHDRGAYAPCGVQMSISNVAHAALLYYVP